MVFVITQPCCNDGACIPACPVDCIHPTPEEAATSPSEMLYIDPDVCIDCGACADVCPVDAIETLDDPTPELLRFAELNAAYFADGRAADASAGTVDAAKFSRPQPVDAISGPLKVAIVGSGPAACYAAEEMIAHKGLDVRITMFERLPTPWGLVRFGVAPDHAQTKQVSSVLQRIASKPNVDLKLNVDVGTDIGLDELRRTHHAVLLATGADKERSLGIPGEDLLGVVSARKFVFWYNGHPDHRSLPVDLAAGDTAVVVGNGNVALDVARVLASEPDRYRGTDIAADALSVLEKSSVRRVVVLGRRGPASAAFSTAELIGLANLPDVDIVVDPCAVDVSSAADRVRIELLRELSARPRRHDRSIELRFNARPVSVRGDDVITSVAIETPAGTETIPCSILVTSIGFRTEMAAGIAANPDTGAVRHKQGRVADGNGQPVPGMYVAGWAKRGPSGVIGTNRSCAQESTRELVRDWLAGALHEPDSSAPSVEELLRERDVATHGLEGWKAIDRHERREGSRLGRPRLKVVARDELVAIAAGATSNDDRITVA